ncbi:MAG: hypothetical protein BGO68_00325 [Candidatus Amoebophilus sp. 36-38]|nr:MAG: hypothetical protein BGO68_00325 [Candidatus Amoebophilus sp. 36-38]
MPIHKLHHLSNKQAYLVWDIQESEAELLHKLNPSLAEIQLYDHFKHLKRRLEWLATRLAYQLLCHEMNIPYSRILKDINGRPYPANQKAYVSLSHSFPYVIAAISVNIPVGIDIQIPHMKLQLIQEKYLSKSEIADASQDVEKLCVYWCTKEAIYKVHGKKTLSLQAITIKPFEKSSHGTIYAQVLEKHHYHVDYSITPNYTLAWYQAD